MLPVSSPFHRNLRRQQEMRDKADVIIARVEKQMLFGLMPVRTWIDEMTPQEALQLVVDAYTSAGWHVVANKTEILLYDTAPPKSETVSVLQKDGTIKLPGFVVEGLKAEAGQTVYFVKRRLSKGTTVFELTSQAEMDAALPPAG